MSVQMLLCSHRSKAADPQHPQDRDFNLVVPRLVVHVSLRLWVASE